MDGSMESYDGGTGKEMRSADGCENFKRKPRWRALSCVNHPSSLCD